MATGGGDDASRLEQIALEDSSASVISRPGYARQASTYSTSMRPSTVRRANETRDEKKTMKSVGRNMKRSIADFFGVGDDEDDSYNHLKWKCRSMKLHGGNALVGGRIKQGQLESLSYDTLDGDSVFAQSGTSAKLKGIHIHDPLHRPTTTGRQDSRVSGRSGYSRQASRISTASSSKRSTRTAPRMYNRQDSVFKMAFDGIKSLSGTVKYSKRKPTAHSRSFAPMSVSCAVDEPDIGIRPKKKPSPTMESLMTDDTVFLDDVFFDVPIATSPLAHSGLRRRPMTPGTLTPATPALETIKETDRSSGDASAASQDFPPFMGGEDDDEVDVPVIFEPGGVPQDLRPTKGGWQIGRSGPQPIPGTPDALDEQDGLMLDGMKKIKDSMMETAFDNSDRRQLGKGCIGRLFKREYKDRLDPEIERQLEEIENHRPYFTYWVTFVQIVICIIAIAVYGIAPIGFEETLISDEVLKHNLAVEKVSYPEKDNLWIGPRQADLIHLGAKFSPCMRLDENVVNAIAGDRRRENNTACCIRNDGSGCVQTTEDTCSPTLSTWHKWTGDKPGPGGRISGSVCGQDPKYCKDPPSAAPFEWADDITTWPICKDSNLAPPSEENGHLTCELVGRPCCVGIQGECIITTREYCEFRRGYFHEEATTCAQISCMNEICGMIQFVNPDKPDQFYRLWTSLFLHAGFLQTVVSVLFQIFIMRDMEKLAGWLRIAIIYIGSGIAGSLASAIFLPYHVEAGPAGSQFGILACLVVEVVQNWSLITNPAWALGKLLIIIFVLFVIGLLPLVDNYAHLFGFIFGFLLSFALLPYVTFGKQDKKWKLFGVIFCLVIACGLFALLIVLFYVTPVYNCPYCHYFNCIPFTSKFCQSMEVKISRDYSYY